MAEETWQDRMLTVPYPTVAESPSVRLMRQDFERLEWNQSVLRTPLKIGARTFQSGLGTHSISEIRIRSPKGIERFSAWIGVDHNERTQGLQGSVVFVVRAGEKELYRSAVLKGGEEPIRLEVNAEGAKELALCVEDGGDGPSCDHADWADIEIKLQGGATVGLEGMVQGSEVEKGRYPFSFALAGEASDSFLVEWPSDRRQETLDADRLRTVTTWTDPKSGLRVKWEAIRYADFPAVEWLLRFENKGSSDSPVISDVRALDVTVEAPLEGQAPYRLHSTHGGTPDPRQFEPKVEPVDFEHPVTLDAGGGRSSTVTWPFFKLETGTGSLVAAVGWSGSWQARFACSSEKALRMTAGLSATNFKLHPGESVRSPRMLLLNWPGDTLESNAQFRQLIYKHYAAKRSGETPLPTAFCNTCFTRGGGWLNECNADNQISLIDAYAKLGLDALMTDAGWFEGGWPEGAGNWTPRKDAYPSGMGPVAAAAKKKGMVYGLWFEPERVVAGTSIHREHPEWCLAVNGDTNGTQLLNFGLPEVQDYFLGIVKGFMDLPGFRVYRQDFNMDPLPYWQQNDAPDRVGITEMKYVEGLYAYWDRIAATWPDSLREECASGGHRIDLETVMRLHIAQKTDYWFDHDVDQAAIWGLSEYLPNNCFVAHLCRTDDYAFRSTLASSLCLGWIADAPDFDVERGKALLAQYRELRPLLVGAWYPLLPYTRDPGHWMASQYHRSDLDRGLLLVFRHEASAYKTVTLSLHGLEPKARYELTRDPGQRATVAGAELMAGIDITLDERPGSCLITYRRME